MSKKTPDISIVICNYNTAGLLKQTLTSVEQTFADIQKEIIVVDDNSSDKSVQIVKSEFPDIRLLVNQKNRGYAASCNIGTKQAKGRYILQLNSDVTFHEGTNIKQLIDYMDKNIKVGIAGCKLLELDGSLDLTCKHSFPTISNIFYQSIGLTKLFPQSKIFGDYYLTYLDEDNIHEPRVFGVTVLSRVAGEPVVSIEAAQKDFDSMEISMKLKIKKISILTSPISRNPAWTEYATVPLKGGN